MVVSIAPGAPVGLVAEGERCGKWCGELCGERGTPSGEGMARKCGADVLRPAFEARMDGELLLQARSCHSWHHLDITSP